MQPLSPVAARRPLVSGAGPRHRWWGCCSFGGLLALLALVGPADAGPRDGSGRAARHAGRTAAAPARAPRPDNPRPDTPRDAHRVPESRATVHRAPDVRAAAMHPSPPPERFAPAERAAGRIPSSRPSREDADVPAAEPVHLALRREAFAFAAPADPSPGLPRDASAGIHGLDGPAPWKAARSRWGFEHGRLAVQLDGGTRLSLRPRRGGLAISLKRSF